MNSISILLIALLVIFIVSIIWIIHVHKALLKKTELITDTVQTVTVSAEVYKTTSQLVAGIAVMAGLLLTIGQLIETKIQYEQTIRNQENQMRQAQELLDLKRFESAILNLESLNSYRRTSGVLTINSIATDNPSSYKQIANDVLIAFIKDGLSSTSREYAYKNSVAWPPRDQRLAIEILSNLLDKKEKFNIRFTKLDFSSAQIPNLEINNMFFINSNFSGANLSKSNLIKVTFNESNMKNANFSGVTLTGSEIIDTDAREANFTASNLNGVSFKRSDLRGARFTATTMIETSFEGADLSGASFTGVIMTNADLRGANLIDVELLSQNTLNTARGDMFTKLPSTLIRPVNWK